jgi:hypothetical protein
MRRRRDEKGGHETESREWFSNGRERHASTLRHWWQPTARRLTLRQTGPEPVLVTVQPVGRMSINWLQLTERFALIFDP